MWELVLSKRLYLINSLMYIFATTFWMWSGHMACLVYVRVSVYLYVWHLFKGSCKIHFPIHFINFLLPVCATFSLPFFHYCPPSFSYSLTEKIYIALFVPPTLPRNKCGLFWSIHTCCWLPLWKNKVFFSQNLKTVFFFFCPALKIFASGIYIYMWPSCVWCLCM